MSWQYDWGVSLGSRKTPPPSLDSAPPLWWVRELRNVMVTGAILRWQETGARLLSRLRLVRARPFSRGRRIYVRGPKRATLPRGLRGGPRQGACAARNRGTRVCPFFAEELFAWKKFDVFAQQPGVFPTRLLWILDGYLRRKLWMVKRPLRSTWLRRVPTIRIYNDDWWRGMLARPCVLGSVRSPPPAPRKTGESGVFILRAPLGDWVPSFVKLAYVLHQIRIPRPHVVFKNSSRRLGCRKLPHVAPRNTFHACALGSVSSLAHIHCCVAALFFDVCEEYCAHSFYVCEEYHRTAGTRTTHVGDTWVLGGTGTLGEFRNYASRRLGARGVHAGVLANVRTGLVRCSNFPSTHC